MSQVALGREVTLLVEDKGGQAGALIRVKGSAIGCQFAFGDP
jgi:hypothetical protein